jgi:hypothetical protein
MFCIPVLLTAMYSLSNYAYADTTTGQLGMKLFPGKIIENSQGLIQVYSKSEGGIINKLVATSSDPSIVKITDITQDPSHTLFTVNIDAVKAGEAKISLAAPGFSSQELTIDVSKNSHIVSKLLVRTTPDTFNADGPKHGYYSVETLNADDFPTVVQNDLPVSIISSDPNILSLKTNQIIIKSGSYYTIGEFDIKQAGPAQISASSSSMPIASASITTNKISSQNIVKLYVYPQKINVFTSANAYAIIQLHDSSGNPVIAKEDTPISLNIRDITNTNKNNTTFKDRSLQINEQPIIKKGSYWAYVPVEIAAGTTDTYEINAYAAGYSTPSTAQVTTLMGKMIFGDTGTKMDVLPILATGHDELIGIAHLEDSSGNIMITKGDLQIHVDSNDLSTVSVLDTNFPSGTQAVPIFAHVGNVANPVTLSVVSTLPQAINATVTAPITDSLTLFAQPLIPKILTGTMFPLGLYMENSGAFNLFKSNFDIFVSPPDVIQTDPVSVKTDSPIQITNSTLITDGTQSISVKGGSYENTFTIEGLSSYPKSAVMDYPDSIVANTHDTFSIQLLDGQGVPVYPDHDVDVKVVSDDPSIIDVPENVQVKKNTYYTTFDVQPKKAGTTEISVLVEKIPLSKFTVSVISFTPVVSIQSADYGQTNRQFIATVTATYDNKPLDGLQVKWKVDGSTILNMSSITDSSGTAKIALDPTTVGTTHIEATVSGSSYGDTVATKDVVVNAPLSQATSNGAAAPAASDTTPQNFTISGMPIILFIIPIVAGIGMFVFKKKEMLQEMMANNGLGEKISEIKEKIMNLRQND